MFNRNGGFSEADYEISSPSTFSCLLPHGPIRHVRHAGEVENRGPFEAVVPSGNRPRGPSPCRTCPFPVLTHHPVPYHQTPVKDHSILRANDHQYLSRGGHSIQRPYPGPSLAHCRSSTHSPARLM